VRPPLARLHEPRLTYFDQLITIRASFACTAAAFAEVTALLGAGEIRAAPLITHRFPFEAYDQGYQMLRAGSGPRGKVMLEVGTP
jgi:threonine dehydrogenase-like Zn-dependent dehydrogenase